eukprot:jgi/Chrzof1/13827/Cz08g14020.t1
MSDMSAEPSEESVPELVTFQCRECYVYVPLPPGTSYGHRAELWNVDKWFKEVKLRVVRCRDDLYVRLEDQESGELFAECPLPSDGTPLTTVVEAVVDSSRYFVLKVVDRASHKHAFMGLGFRERSQASNFTAALDDYRQFLRRQREAEQMKQRFDAARDEEQPATADEQALPLPDYSLKPGQTIKLKLSNSIKRQDPSSDTSPPSLSTRVVLPAATPDTAGLLKLPPPPPANTPCTPAASAASLSSPPVSKQAAPLAVSNPSTPAGLSPATSTDAGMTRQLVLEQLDPAVGNAATEKTNDDSWGDFVG